MELKLPLVVLHHASRNVEAWLPHFPSVRAVGPSLAELRDALALAVMEDVEDAHATELGRYQLPPHITLKHVKIDTVARDRKAELKYELKGTLGILVEKWPADDFWVATPTRAAHARFAFSSPSALEEAAAKALSAYCLKHRITSLEAWHTEKKERLDLLEVDAYLPSILPRAPKPPHRAPRKTSGAQLPETPLEKEERRRRRRLTAFALREVGRNLTHAAMDDRLERAFGREGLVQTLVDEFESREGVAICLVGPSGVGKTAIIHEVTRRLHERYAAANTRRDVWRVDGNRFISGMSYVGEWEQRARDLIGELVDLGDILYVDDLTSLAFAGRTSKGNTNVAQFMEPHLARGELTILAESSPERFQKLREEAPTFASQFRVVPVPDLTDRETLPVLLGALRELESNQGSTGIRLSPAALESVLQLTRRFLAHDAFPGKAVRLLKAVTSKDASVTGQRLDVQHVFAAFRRQTGLPAFILGEQRARTRQQIESDLSGMVVGQPDAIAAVSDVILSMQQGLSDPEKPLGTFLFVGPTGVGKTETAKALATYLFGNASRLLRFDMSEFSTPWSITRLVGSPEEPEGELTVALRTQPFCVILFDEVEKAHPRVFDALLQLLGEGRITDATGRTADARQSVIIMTSNLGVREAASRTGFLTRDEGEARTHYVSAAQRFFRPEFFNRIDRVVPFHSLGPAALRAVVEHALTDLLGRRGIQRGNVLVDVEPELLDLLVEQAFDPRYGARPLKRALERRLTVPLAHHLVRRQDEDISRVELFRRGVDMGLSVTALRPPPRLPGHHDAARWSPQEVMHALDEATGILDQLVQSSVVDALRNTRSEMLKKGGNQDVAALELLDELAFLDDEASQLSDELLEKQFVEARGVYAARTFDPRDSRRIQPRPMVTAGDVQVRLNVEAVVHRTRPRVTGLWQRALILCHQLGAHERGEQDTAVALVESASSDVVRMMLAHLGQVLPERNRRAQSVEVNGAWRTGSISDQTVAPDATRGACLYSGPGVRAMLEPLAGYALLQQVPDNRRVLARVTLLAGDNVAAAVSALDAERARAAAARRTTEGSAENTSEVLAWEKTHATFRHLATGLAADQHDAITAAVLTIPGR